MSLLTGAILAPFAALPPIWGLVFLSALAGVALLLIFGKVSNQQAIKRIKREIYAALLESVLFRHDLRLCLGAQKRLFIGSAKYFMSAVPPVLILAAPCILIMAQINARYDARAFAPGEYGLVKIALADTKAIYDIRLAADPNVEVSKPLRVPSTGEVVWKIRALEESEGQLGLELGSASLKLPLRAGSGAIEAGAYRSWWMALLYPGKLDLGSFPIEHVSIGYPKVNHSLLGLQLHWLVIFLIVSLGAGLAASRVFKVEI